MIRPSSFALYITFAAFLICGCGKRSSDGIDWDALITEYSEPRDSLKLGAVDYLKQALSGLTSEEVVFRNRADGKEIRLEDMTGNKHTESSIRRLTESGFTVHRQMLKDSEVLTTEDIRAVINQTYDSLDDSPWGNDIPKELIYEYLLSYKISTEYPGDWRTDFRKVMDEDYEVWLDTNSLPYRGKDKKSYIDSLVNTVVNRNLGKVYTYSLSSLKLGTVPSYKELKLIGKGDCFYEATANNYLFKSIGLPATYDVIPCWGSANGTHALSMYYNPGEKKMRLIIGLLYTPAKVFRRTFKRYNIWSEEISPVVGDGVFLLDFLKSDRLIDVTKEHTETADIRIRTNNILPSEFAYITVQNYGKWTPIFWGKTTNGVTTYKDMGVDMLYRAAIQGSDGELAYGQPFFLNRKKKMVHPDIKDSRVDITVTAVNQGKESTINAGSEYVLYALDRSGEELPLQQQTAKTNGKLVFEDVSESTFYKVVDMKDNRNLSRFFSINNNMQVWH